MWPICLLQGLLVGMGMTKTGDAFPSISVDRMDHREALSSTEPGFVDELQRSSRRQPDRP